MTRPSKKIALTAVCEIVTAGCQGLPLAASGGSGRPDPAEAEARRDKRNHHSGREARQDNEGSAPRHAPRGLGYIRVDQHFALEGVVGDVDAHEQSQNTTGDEASRVRAVQAVAKSSKTP
jgi:hypothetical protein